MSSELVRSWRRCGITEGAVVLIHSSVRRTLRTHELTPSALMETFLDAVGSQGTVLFPLFNFDFARGVPFDVRATPSQMGALTEAARNFPGAVRTGHPIYSFAAIGARANEFAVDNFSGYGADSPFAILRSLDGMIGVLDLDDQNSMTSYHHVEEMHEVNYRHHKKFTGGYTDVRGQSAERTYGLFVRDLERGVVTHVNPMGELLWQQGLYSGDRPNEKSGLRVISANGFFEAVSEIIASGRARGMLYELKPSEN